jgi:hypothetical protein
VLWEALVWVSAVLGSVLGGFIASNMALAGVMALVLSTLTVEPTRGWINLIVALKALSMVVGSFISFELPVYCGYSVIVSFMSAALLLCFYAGLEQTSLHHQVLFPRRSSPFRPPWYHRSVLFFTVPSCTAGALLSLVLFLWSQ